MACTDAGDGGRYSSSSRFQTPSDRGEHDAGDSKEFIIALDEGTTNAKAVVLDSRGKVIVNSRSRWRSKRRATAGGAIGRSAGYRLTDGDRQRGGPRWRGNVAALAISNQRETAIGWYRDSGEPINAAITGNAPAAPRSATRCVTIVRNSTLSVPPACQSPRCSRPPKCAGCWMRLSMATCAPNAVRFASAPSTAGCCGI